MLNRNRRPAFTLVELLVVIAIIGMLIALLLPAVQAAREAGRRANCASNLHNLVLAVHNYADVHNELPAGCVRSRHPTGGSRTWTTTQLSWITHVLPYMEQSPLHGRVDFTPLRNGSSPGTNRAVMLQELPILRCPSNRAARGSHSRFAPTNYVASVGGEESPYLGRVNEGAFVIVHIQPDGSKGEAAPSMSSVTASDGTSNTMALSECLVNEPWVKRYASDNGGYQACKRGSAPRQTRNVSTQGRGYSWFYGQNNQAWSYSTHFRPNDRITARQNHECHLWTSTGVFAARSRHPTAVNVCFLDGSVAAVKDTIDIVTWRALGTRNRGEQVGER